MTYAHSARPSSRALTVCSIVLIVIGIPALAHEVRGAIDGASSSAAALAVSASCVSAVVGLLFLAWVARFAPSVLSWIAAFAWGTGGALMIAGIGNGLIDAAVESTSMSDSAVDFVTSVVTGPVVEETAKGIGVLILILAARKLLTHPSQGAVLGVLVGLGFAWGEDMGYYVSALEDGMGGLWESFLARAILGGYGHAIFTGVFGYALAWAALRAKNVCLPASSLLSVGSSRPSCFMGRPTALASLRPRTHGTSPTELSSFPSCLSALRSSCGACVAIGLPWRHERTRLACGRGRLSPSGGRPRPLV